MFRFRRTRYIVKTIIPYKVLDKKIPGKYGSGFMPVFKSKIAAKKAYPDYEIEKVVAYV